MEYAVVDDAKEGQVYPLRRFHHSRGNPAVIAFYIDKIALVSEAIQNGLYKVFSEPVESDHAAQIDVIVPRDEVLVSDRAKTRTLSKKKGNTLFIYDPFGFLQHLFREFRVYGLQVCVRLVQRSLICSTFRSHLPPVYPESAESTNFPKDELTGVPRHEATYEPIHMKIESQSLPSSHDFHTLWCGWPPT